MRHNLSHIIAAAFNEPLLLEPAYARIFFCALGREMGAASLSVPIQKQKNCFGYGRCQRHDV
ncbi:TPA: phage tail protein [Escherichia coli]|nr:phage tail protein [Escherichia coli]